MEEEIIIERTRRRTMSLRVGRKGEIAVRAPYGVSREKIADFVRSHRRWIERRRAELDRVPSFEFGERVTLFGKEYSIAAGRTRIAGDEIRLPRERFEQAFARLVKKTAKEYLLPLAERLAKEYGFSYACVRISSARTRWGSCNSRGNLNFAYRLAFLPTELTEYVVVHELCHTRFLNHGASFWAEVKKILPDYALRRARLKSYSAYMNIFPDD